MLRDRISFIGQFGHSIFDVERRNVGRFLKTFELRLVNRHVFVVLSQCLAVFCDLNSIRIEDANPDMFAAKFHRPICWRNPPFEGGTSTFVANGHSNVCPFKRPNSDAILAARFRGRCGAFRLRLRSRTR